MAQQLRENIRKFEEDVGTMVSDTGQVLKAAGQNGKERYAAARGRLQERWTAAKEDLGELKHSAAEYTRSAAKATDGYVHDHPWTSAGLAAGIGALVGWLVHRDVTRRHH